MRERLQGGRGVDMAVRCRRSSPRCSHGLPRCRHSKSEEARENGEVGEGVIVFETDLAFYVAQ